MRKRNKTMPSKTTTAPKATTTPSREVTTVPDKHPADIPHGALQVIAGRPCVNTVGLSQYLDLPHDDLCNFVRFLVARDIGLAKVDVTEVVIMVAVGGRDGKAVAANPCYNLSVGVLNMLAEVFAADPVRRVRIDRLGSWFSHAVLDEGNRRRALPRSAEDIACDPGLLREVLEVGKLAPLPWLPSPLLYEPGVISRDLTTGEITIRPTN